MFYWLLNILFIYFQKHLNQIKPSYMFLALCSVKTYIIFSNLNIKLICGVKLRIFKNY